MLRLRCSAWMVKVGARVKLSVVESAVSLDPRLRKVSAAVFERSPPVLALVLAW